MAEGNYGRINESLIDFGIKNQDVLKIYQGKDGTRTMYFIVKKDKGYMAGLEEKLNELSQLLCDETGEEFGISTWVVDVPEKGKIIYEKEC